MASKRPALTPELRAEAREDFVQCHALQHRWEPIPVTTPPSFGAAIDLRCETCHTVRRDIFSRITGQMLGRSYDYPEDYHDYQRHDKAWWRAWFAEQLYERDRELINIDAEAAKQNNRTLEQRKQLIRRAEETRRKEREEADAAAAE